MKALISVSDKTGIVELAKALHALKVELVSTGGTAKLLAEQGLPVTEVAQVTEFPEMLDGRVKTLHPKVHGGLLARRDVPEHMAALKEHGIQTIDLLIVNLYPFEATVAKPGCTLEDAIENIDIGGPAMVRSAAKNWKDVAVLTDASQYAVVIEELKSSGKVSDKTRFALSVAAFNRISNYDAAISDYLSSYNLEDGTRTEYPAQSNGRFVKLQDLRYGENPHQRASIYCDGSGGIVQAKQLHGKEMSFNNYTDADAAWRAAHDHADPCVAIIKHANPCGIAVNKDIAIAYTKAFECDSVSAYGAVVAANRIVTTQLALALSETFTEVLVAPGFESGALEVLTQKPSIRILECVATKRQRIELRPISGGALLQEVDAIDSTGDSSATWKLVAGSQANSETLKDLEFAWRAVRSVKSNAILLAKGGATIGVGMGQVNRVDSAELAVKRAGIRAAGSVASSDAFFPFADGLKVLISAGITAVVSPGGSVRDEEVIAAAEQAGITLYFTGTRHFSHS